MFATNKTNFLIIDTCTLLQCGDLILTMLTIIRKKKLKFIIVNPTTVVIELKGQEYNRTGHKQLDTYLSWAKHPLYKVCTKPLAKQASLIISFLEHCRAKGVPNLRYQGNLETRHYPIKVAEDLLLDCLLYYHEQYVGNVTLISHDWELYCKANVFKMNYISQTDHEKWRELLRACQVNLYFPMLPATSKKRKDVLSDAKKQELMYRPMVECDLDIENMYYM